MYQNCSKGFYGYGSRYNHEKEKNNIIRDYKKKTQLLKKHNKLYYDKDNPIIDDHKYDELKRFSIQKNGILMSCSGTIGKTSLVRGEFEKGIINQALLIIRLEIPENTHPKYIQTVFSSSFFQEQVIDNSQGGAMKNLVGIDIFKNVKVPIPDPSEQLEILKYIDKKCLILDLQFTEFSKYNNLFYYIPKNFKCQN